MKWSEWFRTANRTSDLSFEFAAPLATWWTALETTQFLQSKVHFVIQTRYKILQRCCLPQVVASWPKLRLPQASNYLLLAILPGIGKWSISQVGRSRGAVLDARCQVSDCIRRLSVCSGHTQYKEPQPSRVCASFQLHSTLINSLWKRQQELCGSHSKWHAACATAGRGVRTMCQIAQGDRKKNGKALRMANMCENWRQTSGGWTGAEGGHWRGGAGGRQHSEAAKSQRLMSPLGAAVPNEWLALFKGESSGHEIVRPCTPLPLPSDPSPSSRSYPHHGRNSPLAGMTNACHSLSPHVAMPKQSKTTTNKTTQRTVSSAQPTFRYPRLYIRQYIYKAFPVI